MSVPPGSSKHELKLAMQSRSLRGINTESAGGPLAIFSREKWLPLFNSATSLLLHCDSNLERLTTGKEQTTGPSLAALEEICATVHNIKQLCSTMNECDLSQVVQEAYSKKETSSQFANHRTFKLLKKWAEYVSAYAIDLYGVKNVPDAWENDRRNVQLTAKCWAEGMGIVCDFFLDKAACLKSAEALETGKFLVDSRA